MKISSAEKLAKLDKIARSRAVKGWVFEGLPAEENQAIKEFLAGGPCPDRYRRLYALSRTQLGLPAELPSLEPGS